MVNCITVRLDSSFIQSFLNQIESTTVKLISDGFPSLDYRWFHGQLPCASPSDCSFLSVVEQLILEERRQPVSPFQISIVSSRGIFIAAAAAA
jgi:hypothetical protein